MNIDGEPVVDYSAPLATVFDSLNATIFGGFISTTVYKTIEF